MKKKWNVMQLWQEKRSQILGRRTLSSNVSTQVTFSITHRSLLKPFMKYHCLLHAKHAKCVKTLLRRPPPFSTTPCYLQTKYQSRKRLDQIYHLLQRDKPAIYMLQDTFHVLGRSQNLFWKGICGQFKTQAPSTIYFYASFILEFKINLNIYKCFVIN